MSLQCRRFKVFGLGLPGRVGACLFAATAFLALTGPVSAHTTSPTSVRWVAGAGAPTIGLIGDSTLSGVRWADRYGDLERFNFLFDAESCRRTIEESCWSREQYRPPTAVEALQAHEGQWGEVLVVMTGYNDSNTGFADGVEAIVSEARRQGIGSVVWLSLRTKGVDYEEPLHLANGSTYRDANRSLYTLADEFDGYLQIADWASHSAERPEWFESDGAHLVAGGVDAVTEFIASQVDIVLSGATITAVPPPWEQVRPGDQGSPVTEVQEALVAAGVYDAADVDGVFGPQTEDAVSDFQRQAGLVESGVVDDATAVGLGLFVAEPRATDTVAAEAGSADAVRSDDSLDPATAPPPLVAGDAAAGGDSIRAVSDRASGGAGVGAWWRLLALLLVIPIPVLLGWRRVRRPDVVGTELVQAVRSNLYDHDREDEFDLSPLDDGASLGDRLGSS